MILLCACCLKREPATGWFAFSGHGAEIDEAFCSADCLDAHTEQTCACFVESDMFEMIGDEDGGAVW